jgi:hypothetical protein
MPQLTKQEILSFTKLLQDPMITAACTENCGCNEACGCKKEGCCEYKCKCDSKAAGQSLLPDDLVKDPKYKDLIKKFDVNQIKTIKDFQGLVERLQAGLKNEGE